MDMKKVYTNLSMNSSCKGVCTGTRWLGGEEESAIESYSPVDGALIGKVTMASSTDYEDVLKTALQAKEFWQKQPAPFRGEVVRQIGLELRQHKEDLGALVSYEMGKSYQEGKGEVQEMIDICDFAVGLSRQLHGLTMHSERPSHRMYEQWHPMGVCAIITAFNFPVAVWAWNSMIAAVCGNVSLWKPSEKTPLTAVACFNIIRKVFSDHSLPEGVMNLLVGDIETVGEAMIHDPRIPLVSATGSTAMGKRVGEVVGKRLGRSILELGGNNAMIITPNADLKIAIPAILFGAVGTAGQRCTTTRRVIVHESLYSKVKGALVEAYGSLKVGNPLDESNHVGPLIDKASVKNMQGAIQAIRAQNGEILEGGEVLEGASYESGCYVTPCLVEATETMEIVAQETFAPILYLLKYKEGVEEAIRVQNSVSQGLSSAIFTTDMRESETFLSHWGSDCGIANVNIGTSGAEIGGAFGGEKDTGGGRESGSDAWKGYMRRQTNTINFGQEMPLAQGIRFDL